MKLYRFWILTLIIADIFVLVLLYSSTVKAEEATAKTVKSETTEDVSWDDGRGPGPAPANMKQPPKSGQRIPKGDSRVPKINRPRHEPFDSRPEPPMDGPIPGSPDDMVPPEMGRPPLPPMDGPNSDFNHGPAGMPPQGPMNPRNRNDVMGPPPTGPFQNWEELEKADPEFFEMLKKDAQLERQTRQLVMQYRQATDSKAKEEIGKKLAQTVAEHFDIRQKRRAMELDRLEKELNRLKALFEKRNQSRDKIIEDRVKELRGDEESLF